MNIDALINEYKDLCRLTDERVQELERRLAGFIHCKPGCHTCCTLTSVLPLEGLVIKKAVATFDTRMLATVRQQAAASSPYCPLLFDGLCLIYQNRPLICRSHGVPVAYIDYDRQALEVSACLLNFPADFAMQEAQLLYMDELNQWLHRLNDRLPRKNEAARESIRGIILGQTG